MLEDCSPLWVSAYFSHAHSSSMAIKCELLALRGGQIGSILWLLCWWTLTGESLVLFFKILSGFIMLWLRDIFLGLTLKSWNTIYLLLSDICVEHPCWKSHFYVCRDNDYYSQLQSKILSWSVFCQSVMMSCVVPNTLWKRRLPEALVHFLWQNMLVDRFAPALLPHVLGVYLRDRSSGIHLGKKCIISCFLLPLRT